ncbi:uncharacterized protein LOC131646563 [Vicia villosa]|uniref:uncharacterized protein LOC131646563 n=1 Tax=Vicia villosa TaxID=3911 RepID=UPI00273B4185|nr:uncharacterized protein LOC131646563 [Vicia villosa]
MVSQLREMYGSRLRKEKEHYSKWGVAAASTSSTDFWSDLTQYFVTDMVLEWACAIGRTHGVVVVTIQSDSANGMRGRKDKLIMGYDRGGNYKKKNEVVASFDGNYTMRLRCPFRLRSAPSGISWKVVVKCGMHNHRLDKDMLGHDILGHLKYDERKFMNDMIEYNMAPRYIVCALKDRDPENLMSITQIYKAMATYRLGKRGALTEMYQLPLFEIVGVTSTKLTFSVAFAYLEHEREENFTWAVERLKELFYYEKLLENVMVTDWKLVLMNVIDYVYPNASHLLCTFHISKNVRMKYKEYVKSERQEHVMDQWNNMMYSNTKDEFDVHLNHFESVCGDIPSFVKVEVAHWRLKNMLTISRGDLCASWELAGYQILDIPIHLESIHVFWIKLKIYKYEVSPDKGKWDLEEECEELKRQFSTMDIVGQRALKKKVRDIAYPSTSSMCPPPFKYKQREELRRVKRRKKMMCIVI